MRFLVSVILLASLPVASVAAPNDGFKKAQGSLKAGCPKPPGAQFALDPYKPIKPRKLGELPPADSYQAVLRVDGNGCLDPLLVRDRIRQSR